MLKFLCFVKTFLYKLETQTPAGAQTGYWDMADLDGLASLWTRLIISRVKEPINPIHQAGGHIEHEVTLK